MLHGVSRPLYQPLWVFLQSFDHTTVVVCDAVLNHEKFKRVLYAVRTLRVWFVLRLKMLSRLVAWVARGGVNFAFFEQGLTLTNLQLFGHLRRYDSQKLTELLVAPNEVFISVI